MVTIKARCGICGTGPLGFRLCDDGMTVVVLCDECDTVWLDATQIESATALYPSGPKMLIPGTTLSIKQAPARWASQEEIDRAPALEL